MPENAKPRLLISMLAFSAFLCLGRWGAAQDIDIPTQGISTIPFSFVPPGARAMGLGGTFIAIADDATASEANPGGLTILTRPEVSLHGRYSRYNQRSSDPNTEFFRKFDPRHRGKPTFPFAEESTPEVSFASIVYPWDRVVVSLYYQRLVRFTGESSIEAIAPSGDPDMADTFFQSERRFEFGLRSVGVSAAFRFNDWISAGFSLRQTQLDAKLEASILGIGPNLLPVGDPRNIDLIQGVLLVDGTSTDFTYNAGFLVNPNGIFSVGFVYKHGGRYVLNGLDAIIECNGNNPDEFHCDPDDWQTQKFNMQAGQTTGRIHVPDFFGLGIAYRPVERLIIAVDADRITYSDLQLEDPAHNRTAEKVNDVTEIHAGIEYTFLPGSGRYPFSVRLGAYHEPDHDGDRFIDSEQMHYTGGLGVAFGTHFQLDLAFQNSDTLDEALLSMVYRF